MKKKIVSVAMACACALSLMCGCGGKTEEAEGGLKDVVLWGMPGTEKVYKDIGRDSDYYKVYKTDARIDLFMAKGEYEGGQIIISADRDVTFDVTGGALTSGDNSIAASDVEIFVQKYVDVLANHDMSSGLPAAKYPDALVPMQNLKAAGENVVKKGENQGIYVRVKTSVEQAAGTYTGSLTLKIGEESTQIPVKVQVADVTVSQEVHNKSVFVNAWYFFEGELDTTQEMLDRYNEALLDYRIGMGSMLTYGAHHNEDLSTAEKRAAWVEKAYGYMQDPACSTIQLPYSTDDTQMRAVLQAVADYSVEKGYDMFAKLVVYAGGLIDEPRGNGKMDEAVRICTSFKNMKNEFSATLTGGGLQTQMAESVKAIPMIVTDYYDETLAEAGATFCPTFQYYDSSVQRAQYENQEGWWYGCISPRAPFPTYHTDDSWLSARLVGWMQAQYNVTGNLYWATDVYAEYSKDGYQSLEEYYEGNAVRYPAVNGDGYLFYPGKKYGIDGPIGSMRLEAIRDGYEEFEILYEIKQNYLAAESSLEYYAPDFEKFVSSLTEDMYMGTTVAATTEEFNAARAALFEASALNKKTGFSVIDYSDDGYGNKTYEFAADSAWTVKENGTEVTPQATENGISVYSLARKLTESKNELCLTFEKEGETVAFNFDLGGKVTVVAATDLTEEHFAERTVEPALDKTAEGWNISLAEIGDPDLADQSFNLLLNGVAAVDVNTRALVLHVWYEGDDEAELMLNGKFKNNNIASTLATCNLVKGENVITIDLSLKDMNALGALERLTFSFARAEEGADIPAHTFTLKDLVYYAG